ncbi:MAG: circularly permuted type 2 ATP-grasp protein [Oscillospiraceae bacterium]
MTGAMTETRKIGTPVGNAKEINELLRRYGVKFGIYKNGVFKEQFFPFDPIPRIITAEDFKGIEKGLVQRVDALNMFLYDIYHEKNIIKDGVVPEDYIYYPEVMTIIKCGKSTERLDLYFRLRYPFEAIELEFERLCDNLRSVPKNTPYRYNTAQLSVLVEAMGLGADYEQRLDDVLCSLGRLFEQK